MLILKRNSLTAFCRDFFAIYIGYVECPKCRDVHQVPEKGFLHHFTLENLLEHLKVHEANGNEEPGESRFTCESGLDTNPVVARCIECQVYLCQPCINVHKRQKMTNSHKILTLAEIREGALTHMHQKRLCSEHEEEELKLYCKTCRDVICRDCTLITHAGHKYVFIKEAKEELVQELQEAVVLVEEKEKMFQKYIDEVDRVAAGKRQCVSLSEHQMDAYFDECIGKIQEHRKALREKLHESLQAEEKVLNVDREDLSFTKDKITTGLMFTKQLLSSGNAPDIARLHKHTLDQLKNLSMMNKQTDIDIGLWGFLPNDDPLSSGTHNSPVHFSPPASSPVGLSTININALKQPRVEVSTSSGISCRIIAIKCTDASSWSVTFIIPAPPVPDSIVISASVEGSSVTESVKCDEVLGSGTVVCRGPDWHGGDLDGGPDNFGLVTVHHATFAMYAVMWQNGTRFGQHKFGNGVYEVKAVC